MREIGEISPSHVQAPTNKKSKKLSIATRTPPQKEGGGGGRSRLKSSKEMTILRTVVFNKMASVKRS